MTEAKKSAVEAEQTSQPAATTTPAVTTPPSSPPVRKGNGVALFAVVVSVLALLLVLAGGAGGYLWSKRQASEQQHERSQFTAQISALQMQRADLQQQLASLAQQQRQAGRQQQETGQQADKQISAMLQQLADMQKKVAIISGAGANDWLLARADFLVKMAGRKLWSEQDSVTAIALLKSADASLADMHDPSLLAARQAINADISTLAALNQVDYDGIILKLNQLANQVDNLRLADMGDSHADAADSHHLSASVRQWRQNLLKSWQHFMDSFITIRRRDNSAVPLLAPDQEIYLRENIRSRLLIAAQAVPRHQQEIYQQSLEAVSTWIRAYYATGDASSKTFLAALDDLIRQPINMDLPDALQSQPLLDKLVQTRLRGGMAPSSAPASEAVPAADSASPDTGAE